MSDVEGLLKLAVLDLSELQQGHHHQGAGPNYSSLRALNLLGNPVQSNVGDDSLRKAVSGLLPVLAYLNKQALKPQRRQDRPREQPRCAGSATARARRRPRGREGSSRSRSQNGVSGKEVRRSSKE